MKYNSLVVGQKVRIFGCPHVDVAQGQEGEIEAFPQSGGYAVRTTGRFAIDFHGYHKTTQTVTVWAEKVEAI